MMDFNKVFVEVVERFNTAHPNCHVEIIEAIEHDVHLYSIEYKNRKGFFTVCKSDAEAFERRLNEHLTSIDFLNEQEEF